MEHSDQFEKVKQYYNMGMWNIDRVRNSVLKGWITEPEFTEITTIPYSVDPM